MNSGAVAVTDAMSVPEPHILEPARCADMIRRSRCVVTLSGAGISTAAGIPDFRGPQGLYVTRRYDPEKVFDIDWFHREPRYFYEFTRDFVSTVKAIRPTFTHRFLAGLEKAGGLAGLITQNIDMLHQLAGSRKVIDLHGSYRSAQCLFCGKSYEALSYTWWERAMSTSSKPPLAYCSACNSVLKPDIVFFGEMVHAFEAAEQLIAQCDLLLVLGSSLKVTPASLLPYHTQATTVVVNRGAVMLPPAPHRFFVDGDLDVYFRAVAKHLDITVPGSTASD
ncbi:NAD-dependent protein deacetylase, Sir2 family [Syntrophotalea carbinolica DSM 2380]|uniref:protein acetyllysine N-acetyltransferase n=1 Tax=Syntrophotalea carbinolica (strain DSM 2380 / NBRC 103641 / GraBd1) TaxID=338963 RepID=Q3A6W7_SYNC1|nr:Sir2 family NAD-dependent protein deacetylase [Syntrophotalea carbinolica]ABA87890.1 NAD-dependent protein deacetylase, Sir2 family [Syntrophotalea carbinolica DSM 2380]